MSHDELVEREYTILKGASFMDKEKLFYTSYCNFGNKRSKVFYSPVFSDHGSDAIFNLRFNQSGILVAVCASGAVVIIDPRVRGIVHNNAFAHDDCANIVAFVSEVAFVTGSDDQNIKIWDLRRNGKSMKTLTGHSGWVKNLEYDSKRQWLYSSSFDCTVLMWDMNNWCTPAKMLLFNPSLFRMCLSSDGSMMMLTTRGDEVYSLLPFAWFDEHIQRLEELDQQSIVDFCQWHSVTKLDFDCSTVFSDVSRRPPFLNPDYMPHICIPALNYHLGDSDCVALHKARLKRTSEIQGISSASFNATGDCVAMRGSTLANTRSGRISRDVVLTYSTDNLQNETFLSTSGAGRISGSYEIPQLEDGIIREVCFDSTGQYVASPADNNILIFDSITSKSNIIGKCRGQHDKGVVLCCQFSPVEPIIAAGDTNGYIGIHYPR